MTTTEHILKSESDTIAWAQDFAASLTPRTVILLKGDLGAGKTTFARALIRALCSDPDLHVPSPTFTLVQTYETDKGDIWHYDCYRIEDENEILELGWDEALSSFLTLIEWPQHIAPYLPSDAITITLDHDPANQTNRVLRVSKESS